MEQEGQDEEQLLRYQLKQMQKEIDRLNSGQNKQGS